MKKYAHIMAIAIRLSAFVEGAALSVASILRPEPITLIVGVLLMYAAAYLYGPLCQAFVDCVTGED